MKTKIISRKVNNMDFKLITIENDDNFKVTLLNYGACLHRIFLDGKILNVSPLKLESYINSGPMYGKTIGRYAGRIENGKFTLNNQDFQLDLNNGGNCLHGGIDTIGDKLFNFAIIENKDFVKVNFYLEDEENLFPGDVSFKICYTIFNNKNDIEIEYNATTNKDTILNLTNHTYFNLNGNKDTILNEELFINANRFTVLKDNMCLDYISEVNEIMNFQKNKLIKKDIENEFLQNHPTKGIDHCFFLNDHTYKDVIASLIDNETKIKLNVYTTYPCVVVYSCNYPEDKKIMGGKYPKKYQGICFECQYMPNSINSNDETILRKEDKYHHLTKFSFIRG